MFHAELNTQYINEVRQIWVGKESILKKYVFGSLFEETEMVNETFYDVD